MEASACPAATFPVNPPGTPRKDPKGPEICVLWCRRGEESSPWEGPEVPLVSLLCLPQNETVICGERGWPSHMTHRSFQVGKRNRGKSHSWEHPGRWRPRDVSRNTHCHRGLLDTTPREGHTPLCHASRNASPQPSHEKTPGKPKRGTFYKIPHQLSSRVSRSWEAGEDRVTVTDWR